MNRGFRLVCCALSFLFAAQSLHAATASDVIPAIAPTGAWVVILGTGLDSAGIAVSFATARGRVPAEILERAPALLRVAVPADAVPGPVVVSEAGATVATFNFSVASSARYTRLLTISKGALSVPTAVWVDRRTGIAYVADAGARQVKRVLTTGEVTVVAGSGKNGDPFREPVGVAGDPERGVLYVADGAANVIFRIALSDGATSVFAGSGKPGDRDGIGRNAEFKRPSGLAVDSTGALFVADGGNARIRRVAPDGTVTSFAGRGTPGHADGPAAQAAFKDPAGVAAAGNEVFVADSGNHAIRKIADGIVTTVAGTTHPGFLDGPPPVAELKSPSSCAVDGNGRLVISDSANHAVRAVRLNELLETIAGSGKPGFLDAADPRAAKFHEPAGIDVAGAVFIADSKNGALRLLLPEVSVTALHPPQGSTSGGDSIRIFGNGFVPGATRVTFGAVSATEITWLSATELLVRTPPGPAGTADVSVETAAGRATLTSAFLFRKPLTAITVMPASVELKIGESLQLAATGSYADGSTADLTLTAVWSTTDASVANVTAAGEVSAVAVGSVQLTASSDGIVGGATVVVTPVDEVPPDPAAIAPPIDVSVATSFSSSTEFLYSGSTPVQKDVLPGSIEAARVAIVRGLVTAAGSPLAAVRVSVPAHPELGSTLTRADGRYDVAVNGGGDVTVRFMRDGYLPADRKVRPRWNSFVEADPVVLVPLDPKVTTVTMGAGAMQVAQGTPMEDADGRRSATVLFPAGTTAEVVLPDGSRSALDRMHLRATEYTVGPDGPARMPAPLPLNAAYTYCVEISADEAIAAGSEEIRLSQRVPVYVENFLGFEIGEPVPVGYYDRTNGVWVANDNGVVLKIVSIEGGVAAVDTDGDGMADSDAALEAISMTPEERQKLGTLWPSGTSLWRFTTDHFSPSDVNWPAAPSEIPPNGNGLGPQVDPTLDRPCKAGGSIIECQNQVLGESIPVAGTPYTLEYRSSRVRGRLAARRVEIILAKGEPPAGVKQIEFEANVAGRVFKGAFSPSKDLRTMIDWDGRDAYGRVVQGAQTVEVKISYVYDAVYVRPMRFAAPTGRLLLGARRELRWTQGYVVQIRPWEQLPYGLGGWSLSVHDGYDRNGDIVYNGDGGRRTGDEGVGIVQTVGGAGLSSAYYWPTFIGLPVTPEGVPARQANILRPTSIATASDGTVYMATGYYRWGSGPGAVYAMREGVIRKIGGAAAGDASDGRSALETVMYPWAVAAASDGSVLFSDQSSATVRRIGRDGIVSRVAGSGTRGYAGDGGPAFDAAMSELRDVVVSADGDVYVLDGGRIRRISTDGRISTVVASNPDPWSGSISEGEPGPSVRAAVSAIAQAPDGRLYFTHSGGVWRLDTDGAVRQVVGPTEGPFGFITFSPSGELFAIRSTSGYFSVYRRRIDGSMERVVGGTSGDMAGADPMRNIYFGGEGESPFSQNLKFGNPQSITVGHDGALLIADMANSRLRRVAFPSRLQRGSETVIPSADGSNAAVFDAAGRHWRTVDTVTGSTLLTFGYDGESRLSTVTDLAGNVTRITHGPNGPESIVAPGGQTTTLTVDAAGHLASITNPAGETVALSSTPEGLLTGLTDPKGNEHEFTFWPDGRLFADANPYGAQTFTVFRSGRDVTVTRRTAMGRTTLYAEAPHPSNPTVTVRTITDAGLSTVSTEYPDGATTTVYPDGTSSSVSSAPDPQWRMESPLLSTTVRTPAGLMLRLSRTRSVSSSSDLLASRNVTDTMTLNGRNWVSTYVAAARTWTEKSPAGRTSVTTLDVVGRPVSVVLPGIEPATVEYDASGHVSALRNGVRWTTLGYDARNRLTGVTDHLARTIAYDYDDADRIVAVTANGTRTTTFGYDADGNLTSVTPPGRSAHSFDFNGADLVSLYAPPTGEPATTRYLWNADGQITTVLRPGGTELGFDYDAEGRLRTMKAPHATYTYGYDAAGRVAAVSGDGSDVAFTYDGSLLTKTQWNGTMSGSVSFTYDNDFRVSKIDGTSLGYDVDGLLVTTGALTLRRDAANGLLTGTTLGGVTDSWAYDSYGEVREYTATYAGAPVAKFTYERDPVGRISKVTETSAAGTTVVDYAYDAVGRLERVTTNGTYTTTYAYDANSNRSSKTTGSVTETGTYDAEDRVLTYGGASFTFTPAGELTSRPDPSGTTSYVYDALGSLRRVTTPSGTVIEYVIDAQNRRVGRKVNGTVTHGWLYADALRIVAELDATGTVVSRFVYGSRTNVPDYLVKGGATYRILSDHLGSPRFVVNTATGAVAQALTYDEFGNVLSDTNPGFQPFGFAGGLYDAATRLVRFGARDYDSRVGRWTVKDPSLFAGGSTNLYEYSFSDAMNFIDPEGTLPKRTDKLFGLPKKFWNWYHRKFKGKGDPNIGPDDAHRLYDEWQGSGCPTPDSKKRKKRRGADDTEWWEDLLDIVIPAPPLFLNPEMLPQSLRPPDLNNPPRA
ncbi:MAG: RHS repeat-associated core domain-containing protein [Thermoanaerobaculia bacterium]